ncbi:hypothetical protein QQP08_020819 [Theobroma cacao]|nr:hypothetical protein QQP08_020819 [Theobroma cacao]
MISVMGDNPLCRKDCVMKKQSVVEGKKRERGKEDPEINAMFDAVKRRRKTMDVPLVRVADVLFTERMKKRLSERRDKLLQNRSRGPQDQGASNDLNQQFQPLFFKTRPALSLNGFTSHQLSLIRVVTRKHFKDLVYVRANGESSSQELVVFTDSESDEDRLVEDPEINAVFDAVKRRRKVEKSSEEISLFVGKVLAELTIVPEDDAQLNREGQPAINKLKKLPFLTEVLSKKNFQLQFLDHGVLTLLKKWLEPLPDGSLPMPISVEQF